MRRKIPWKTGYLVIEYTSERIKIESPTTCFEIRPRYTFVKNYNEYREVVNKKKYIYVYFKEELKPYINSPSSGEIRYLMNFYEIRHVKTFYDEYYTILLPGIFFFDYIVFNSEELLLVLSSKKKTFYEEINNMITIYVV